MMREEEEAGALTYVPPSSVAWVSRVMEPLGLWEC